LPSDFRCRHCLLSPGGCNIAHLRFFIGGTT
jgi:hypothetical protein